MVNRRFASIVSRSLIAIAFMGTTLFANTTLTLTDPASRMTWTGGSATSVTAAYTFTAQGQVTKLTGMRVRMICEHTIQRYINVEAGPPDSPFTSNFTCPASDKYLNNNGTQAKLPEQMTLAVEAINNLGGVDGTIGQTIDVSLP